MSRAALVADSAAATLAPLLAFAPVRLRFLRAGDFAAGAVADLACEAGLAMCFAVLPPAAAAAALLSALFAAEEASRPAEI